MKVQEQIFQVNITSLTLPAVPGKISQWQKTKL